MGSATDEESPVTSLQLSEVDNAKYDLNFKMEFDRLPEHLQRRVTEWEDAIQPHTDEGGDAYYIGDAYEAINWKCAQEWAVEEPGRYLQYVKHISKSLPHLEYLAHWMEVTCAPPKWKFLRNYPDSRQKRAERTKACIIDYVADSAPRPQHFNDAATLKAALATKGLGSEKPAARLVILEDLSRSSIEVLGEYFNMDPLVFRSQISDYLFHNTRDRWVEPPRLEIDSRAQSHLTLSYLRPRYFKHESEFELAERESGKFNVLRRLDSDRSRKHLQGNVLDLPEASVTLTRAKMSLWVTSKQDGEPPTCVLLIDPTVTGGYPLWGGHSLYGNLPTMKEWLKDTNRPAEAPQGKSLFDDVVLESSRMSSHDLVLIQDDPKCMAIPMLKFIVADWLILIKYMATMLSLIEWSFERPTDSGVDIIAGMENQLRKLSPWRRNFVYYETMIAESIARLFPNEYEKANDPNNIDCKIDGMKLSGLHALYADFRTVEHLMKETKSRLERMESKFASAISLADSHRADNSMKQNRSLGRITMLATIFLPLNFASSFLSMSPDFSANTDTFWLFFALGVPLTLIVVVFVLITRHGTESLTNSLLQSWRRHGVPSSSWDQESHDHSVVN
ncbi:hypothetical protein HII31_03245 [Pseudocercospora fuligena]|uniref:Uncharacterized protein n=1 Tax=Pseudocercospora fuligena TaxID=685502 RepID=A0A8H6RR16_9PEZI|nr:hypothetical protein HII31_03245 [Pseudocercospora fuligena]